MEMQIQAQGNYEGSCFLYSVANAYGALTGRIFPQAAWDERTKTIPFQAEFLTSNGTFLYNDEDELYVFAINRLLNEYGNDKFSVEVLSNIRSGHQLAEAISENSVLIVNIRSKHWVCAVDHSRDKTKLLMACSSQLFEMRTSYREMKGPIYSRLYNREEAIEEGAVRWLKRKIAIKISKAARRV